MKDNFDLKKFLKESKAIENLNPTFKSINEGIFGGKENEKLKKKIFELAEWFMDSKNHNLLRLGELLNGETYPDVLEMRDEIKSSNYKAYKRFTILLKDLQTVYNQKLKSEFPEGDPTNTIEKRHVKLTENDFSVVALYLHQVFSRLFPTFDIDKAELAKLLKVDHLQSTKENSLKERIREMIINELSEDGVSVGGNVRGTINPGGEVVGKENPYNPTYESKSEDLHEEEKDEDGEEMEDESREERADVDKYEYEKGKEDGEEEDKSDEGGIEAIAADLDGTESDLMGNLMNALKIAKGMDNEKLEVQIGNTLKFFVSTYIDKEEN